LGISLPEKPVILSNGIIAGRIRTIIKKIRFLK